MEQLELEPGKPTLGGPDIARGGGPLPAAIGWWDGARQ